MRRPTMKFCAVVLCLATGLCLILAGYIDFNVSTLTLPLRFTRRFIFPANMANLLSNFSSTVTSAITTTPTTTRLTITTTSGIKTSSNVHEDLKQRLGLRKRSPQQNKRIAIFAAFSNSKVDAEKAYKAALASLRCYAKYNGYFVEVLYGENLAPYAGICNHTDFFFKRHCLAKQILVKYDWMLAIDGDVGVTNPYYLLEDHIDEGVSVSLYDRYYNSEVAATNYFVRNDSVGYAFLNGYADYQWKLPSSFHGTDNGALHHHLLTMLYPNSSILPICTTIWKTSQNHHDLFQYESCIRFAFGSIRRFPGQISIARKGEAWVRDAWITNSEWSYKDFLLHSWRERFVNTDGARSRWKYPYNPLPDPEKCSPDKALSEIWPFVPELYRVHEIVSVQLEALKREADGMFWAQVDEMRKKYGLTVF